MNSVKARLTIFYTSKNGTHLTTHRFYESNSWTNCVMAASVSLRQFARYGTETQPGSRNIIAAELSSEDRAENGATTSKVFQPEEWK